MKAAFRVNLAPEIYRENPLWWVPDVITLVAAVVLGLAGVQFFLNQQRSKLVEFDTKIQENEQIIAQLAADVERHNQASQELDLWNKKLLGLEPILGHSAQRYALLIVLEHLQVLRPTGLWFSSVRSSESPKDADKRGDATPLHERNVVVQGFAVDPFILAEFVGNLRATQVQEVSDTRSKIFFRTTKLINSALADIDVVFSEKKVAEAAMTQEIYKWTLVLEYEVRESTAPTVALRGSDGV